jgi:epsilon-lactone hydrolase
MQNWQTFLPARLARRFQSAVDQTTTIEEVRARYQAIAAAFGLVSADIVVERAQLGGVRAEWLRLAESEPQRLILYLHGGGYISGSPEKHRSLAAKLCRVGNAAVLSIAYRLGPEFPFPAGLRDAVDAYRFLIARAVPPESIILAGDGAGGGLAFSTAMAIRNAGVQMPAGIVAMSPWADLTLSGWSMMQNAENDDVLSWDLLFVSARHYLKGASPADPYASAVFGNMRDFPPIMVHAGSREILRDDASRLGELAAAANIPVSVEVYDGMQHLFQASVSGSDAKVSLNRIGQFIRARAAEAAHGLDLGKSSKRG